MSIKVNVTLKKEEKERLSRLALQYGLSLPEFFYKILTEIQEQFPKESFSEYKSPKTLRASLTRALRDWRKGRVSATR